MFSITYRRATIEVMIEREFSSHHPRGFKGKVRKPAWPFDEELNLSAENIARYFVEYLNTRVGDERVKIYKVRCYETPTSVATCQID